jgi:hypothetical protein
MPKVTKGSSGCSHKSWSIDACPYNFQPHCCRRHGHFPTAGLGSMEAEERAKAAEKKATKDKKRAKDAEKAQKEKADLITELTRQLETLKTAKEAQDANSLTNWLSKWVIRD